MTHVIDLMSTRTSADFCIESKKRKRSCHHRGPQRLPLGAGLWPAGRGLHMPALIKRVIQRVNVTSGMMIVRRRYEWYDDGT